MCRDTTLHRIQVLIPCGSHCPLLSCAAAACLEFQSLIEAPALTPQLIAERQTNLQTLIKEFGLYAQQVATCKRHTQHRKGGESTTDRKQHDLFLSFSHLRARSMCALDYSLFFLCCSPIVLLFVQVLWRMKLCLIPSNEFHLCKREDKQGEK